MLMLLFCLSVHHEGSLAIKQASAHPMDNLNSKCGYQAAHQTLSHSSILGDGSILSE